MVFAHCGHQCLDSIFDIGKSSYDHRLEEHSASVYARLNYICIYIYIYIYTHMWCRENFFIERLRERGWMSASKAWIVVGGER